MNELSSVQRRTLSLTSRLKRRGLGIEAYLFKDNQFRWERRALTETLISDLWQSWNEFVREVLIQSCAGTTTRSGVAVAARAADNSWQRISYEASLFSVASRQRKAKPRLKARKVNVARRQDPTWGDLDIIVDVVTWLAPSNAVGLITAFGATSRGLKHLQLVRNACFHKNNETWQDVKALEALYFASSDTADVADLAWKPYLGKTVPAIYDWIDAFVAISSATTR